MAFHGGPSPANLAAGALGGRRELSPVLRRRPCVVAGMAPAGRSIRPFGRYSRPSIHEPHGHGRSPRGKQRTDCVLLPEHLSTVVDGLNRDQGVDEDAIGQGTPDRQSQALVCCAVQVVPTDTWKVVILDLVSEVIHVRPDQEGRSLLPLWLQGIIERAAGIERVLKLYAEIFRVLVERLAVLQRAVRHLLQQRRVLGPAGILLALLQRYLSP